MSHDHLVQMAYYYWSEHFSLFFKEQPHLFHVGAVPPSEEGNRVLKCDVIKMKFLKSWDLSGYSERTMSKRPTCQK